MLKFHICAISACVANVLAKSWNNTGRGSIVLEESFSLDYPELDRTIGVPVPGETYQDLLNNPADIHNQRIQRMNDAGVDYMVLSLTSPGIQAISDVQLAEEIATRANNDIAAAISNNTVRFGAFAALSMHNVTQAALELRRCVQELGFHGALLNDFQQAGEDNSTLHYYDTPEYDPFWQEAADLDVPVYLHPRPPTAAMTRMNFAHAPWLLGPSHQFAVTLSGHVAGLVTNGVFDRFPTLKVIVGHLGERLPSDFWRIDSALSRRVRDGIPMQRPFSSYWRTNIWETSSADFWTELVDFHRSLVGSDRVMYSVDYPFVTMQEGAEWLKTLPQNTSLHEDFIRNIAISLLKLET